VYSLEEPHQVRHLSKWLSPAPAAAGAHVDRRERTMSHPLSVEEELVQEPSSKLQRLAELHRPVAHRREGVEFAAVEPPH